MEKYRVHAPGLQMRVRFLFESVLDFVYPPRCVSCGSSGDHWCVVCQAGISSTNVQICLHCRSRLLDDESSHDCMPGDAPALTAAACAVYAGSIRKALLQLKYRPNRKLADSLSAFLEQRYLNLGWQADFVTAVPLGRSRLRLRGYNQAGLLAEAFSRRTGLPFRPEIIRRRVETISQVGLGAEDRAANVAGAFEATSTFPETSCILVIDDLLTTGSTLRATAIALHKAGVRKVLGLTVAQASK